MSHVIFQSISHSGLGTTNLWSGRNLQKEAVFLAAIREHHINVIDTAEMYGKAEEGVSHILKKAGRENIYLIDKIHPDNCTERNFEKSLLHSLRKLDTDHIDLYLLHWRENVDLAFLSRSMEAARERGLIREWGVSNFDTQDLKDLYNHTDSVYANEIFYSVFERGIEFELLPFMHQNNILPISYSTLGSSYHPHPNINQYQRIISFCKENNISGEAALLERIRAEGVLTLFSTSSLTHLNNNLTEIPEGIKKELFQLIDEEFPSPTCKYPMVKI